MKTVKLNNANFWIYSLKEALYAAALPMVNGSLIQIFLTNKGLSTRQVGLFNTAIFFVSVLTSICFSVVADRNPNALKQSARIMLMQCLAYLPFLLVGYFSMPLIVLFLATIAIVLVQTVLNSQKGILEYRVPYQIIQPEQYGPLNSWCGALIGVTSLLASLTFSWLIDSNAMGNPYLVCILLSQGLLLISWLGCRKLKVTNDRFGSTQSNPMSMKQLWGVLSDPIFKSFLVPNTLRGITFGIISSLPLIALALGFSESVAAQIPVMNALGYVAASVLFNLLSKWFSVCAAGLAGSVLLLCSAFLGGGSNTLFLTLVFITYAGRILVDYAIPVMVFHMIDPKIAGVYNTWRGILLSLSTMITTYLVGILATTEWLWLLLILCAVCYGVSMVWYTVVYRRMKKVL